MPGDGGVTPLKCNPSADLITAKPNKQKSISEQKEGKRECETKKGASVMVFTAAPHASTNAHYTSR